MISKPAILFALESEIKHAESCLQPHDTGHICTAISWMQQRVREIKQELKEQHEKNIHH